MLKVIENAVVEILNKKFIIKSPMFAQDAELQQEFEKRIAGRASLDKENNLVFEAYNTGANPPTTQYKEAVGMVQCVRTPKLFKFTLSLPATMTPAQVRMAVMEQYGLLLEALREGGLYERLTGTQTAAQEAPTAA
ncbi:MAG: hypothetical protein IKT92_06310 [Bacteroidaceae bacterium]|nr:hypothetical protein [Bacteroidaceae bacterium]